jgi:YD repeat-containing protein
MYTYDENGKKKTETLNSHTTQYDYDELNRLINKQMADGSRTTYTFTYNVNDRMSTESYDPNGNTTLSGARTFTYNFENRLKTMNGGAVTNIYDGDGNRAARTVGGVTTRYLVDDLNPTGYAQVVEELVGGVVQRTYTYGPSRISQAQASGTSFYGYDGMGSVRFLTDATGAVIDRYDYDAWGNTVNTTGSQHHRDNAKRVPIPR